MTVLEIKNVVYEYAGTKKKILDDLSIHFDKGKVYGVIGKSGSGKTTLLSLMAGLDVPTEGKIYLEGVDVAQMDRDLYRSQKIGVVFQAYNLLTNATALENIVLSMNISKSVVKNKKEHALTLLEKLGIDEDTANRKVLKLSGGEQQRIAIARALAHDPEIILADEPTGNLDSGTEEEIITILKKLAHEENKCVIIVTHSQNVSKEMDVLLRINRGKLKSDK